MLIGGRGNLVNRVTSLCAKYKITDGMVILRTLEKFMEEEDGKVNPLAKLFDGDFDTKYVEEKYLDKANVRNYLGDWYKLVQKANEFITKAEPWKKYKRPATRAGAISDLQFLLYIVKNLALLSAPFLVNGFKKIQDIFGNEEFSQIDSSVSTEMNEAFATFFNQMEFKVNLNPEIIYEKKDAGEVETTND